MLLFAREGVAYVHVPKTSGKRMRSVLRSSLGSFEEFWGIAKASGAERKRFDMVDRAHYTAETIREFHPDLWARMLGMTCFSVARDPYSRAASAYQQFRSHFGGHEVMGRVRSLSDYLVCVGDELYRRDRDGYLYIHGVPQVRFHLPGHRVIFGEDLTASISGIFGREIRFRSAERPCGDLSADERRLVERVYREDLEMWDRVSGSKN